MKYPDQERSERCGVSVLHLGQLGECVCQLLYACHQLLFFIRDTIGQLFGREIGRTNGVVPFVDSGIDHESDDRQHREKDYDHQLRSYGQAGKSTDGLMHHESPEPCFEINRNVKDANSTTMNVIIQWGWFVSINVFV